MLFYFSIVLGALSVGGILVVMWRQLAEVRTIDSASLPPLDLELGEILQRKVDALYYSFTLFFKRLVHYSYLYSLLGLRRLIIIMRYLLTRVERKFARLIDSVHGRGVISKDGQGPASPFISEMKDHQKTFLAGIKSGE